MRHDLDTPDLTDEALLAAIAARDDDAFVELVKRHHASIQRFVSRLVSSTQACEDVIQETWLATLNSAGSFRGTSSVRVWLFGIARNKAARHYRRRSGEPARFEALDVLAVRAGWGQEPARAEASLELREVLTAMQSLPEPAREVLVLRDIEGLTNPEVAQVLDLSVAAVKSRIHRARLTLMACLRQEVCDG